MKKKLNLIITLLGSAMLLTACGGKTNQSNSTNSTSKSKTSQSVKSSNKKNTNKNSKNVSKESSKAEEESKKDDSEVSHNLIGTWQSSDNQSISLASDGSYTLSADSGNHAGLFTVAGEYDQTIVLKMTNFDEKTPGLETYVTIELNPDKTIELGKLGQFKSLGNNSEIPRKLFIPNYLTEKPETDAEKLVGTWTNVGTGAHNYLTTNYNPDGTYESFSDASGMVAKGRYTVTNNDDKIEITYSREGQEPSKVVYTMSDSFSTMTQNEPGMIFTYHKI